VELRATSAAAAAVGGAAAGALLSVARLRRLLAPSAPGDDGSGT
jgi:hypothetical protein